MDNSFELLHRVKNNLQAIVTMMEINRKKIDCEDCREILDSSIRQLMAMSNLYSRLEHKDNDLIVDLGSYVKGIVDDLSRLWEHRGIDIRCNIEQIVVPMQKASYLGIVVNECVTNAMRHAFPKDAGKIVVSLSSDGQSLKLSVADDGVGVSDSGKQGSGRKIMDSVVSQLGGKMTISSEYGRTVVDIFLPTVVNKD